MPIENKVPGKDVLPSDLTDKFPLLQKMQIIDLSLQFLELNLVAILFQYLLAQTWLNLKDL